MRAQPLNPRWNLILTLLLACAGVVAVGNFMNRAMASTAFWYDESVQYWISRGLDAFGPPFQTPGGLADVMKHNGLANLDPGGFSVIFYYWLLIARDPLWMRILPLAIFLVGMLSLGWLGWRWRQSWRFALLSALMPAAFPLLLDHANETRAYSMEFTGVFVGCLLVDLFLTRPKPATSLIAGLLLGLFLTSRYSAIFIAGAISVIWLLQVVRLPVSWSRRTAHLLLFFVPLGLAGLGVVFLGFVPQYHARIAYDGGTMVEYLNPHKLGAIPWADTLKLLADNLFSLVALPTTVIPAIALFLLKKPAGSLAEGDVWHRSRQFYLMSLAAVLFTAALWKWHPWAVQTKWSSYLHALSAVMLVRLTADVLESLSRRRGLTGSNPVLQEAVLAAAICVLCTCLVVHRQDLTFDLEKTLAYLDRHKPKRGTVAVEVHSYPTLRYFYDEGPFCGTAFYPRAFRLPNWQAPNPLIGENTLLLLSGARLEQLSSMYPGFRFTVDPKLPRNLVRVEPSTVPLVKPATPASPP
ncbi:hypothetical protein [Verrucomicrobium sp. BvORR034]|uniref:hypothetical protein n=1 Tax=Verrucomicrobium sp. BvORR034 TaxID=1396418 RepID=UPI0006794A03|nr:hypothetical protein [Verrucomicrobium sp. BvORR034]